MLNKTVALHSVINQFHNFVILHAFLQKCIFLPLFQLVLVVPASAFHYLQCLESESSLKEVSSIKENPQIYLVHGDQGNITSSQEG